MAGFKDATAFVRDLFSCTIQDATAFVSFALAMSKGVSIYYVRNILAKLDIHNLLLCVSMIDL